jgi:Ca2+/Na+ antiporter
MSLFVNIVMMILFLLFMIFIFGGYHKNKSAQRELQRETDEKKIKDKDEALLK